jgi:glutamate 5-kinase
VFYAVKPWQMEAVLRETAPSLDYGRQTIVSIAPGIKPEQLKEWLEKDGTVPSIAYVIPNTAIEIGESMTYISAVTASDEQVSMLKSLFDRVGKTQVVPLEHMLYGTSLASCGIAYAMRYISASAEGGAQLGLEPEGIGEAVCQTVRGAAALVGAKGFDPEHEIDRVTTPNGLTIRGLNAMEEAGFSDAVIKGLKVIKAPRKRRIVVKVGSNVLTRSDGSLDTTRVSSIVDQIVELRGAGYETVLVTSGAVACGRSLIREDRKLTDVQQRQLYSAIGQVRLMDLYYRLFQNYGITVGQVLTMKKNFDEGQEYENQKSCMEVMLQSHVLPVVNENDTVSITELMFTDNDELSGLVAGMVGAETLIILSNVDGVYDGQPEDPYSKVIPIINPTDSFEEHISTKKSSSGRGGMASKCNVARKLAAGGIRVIIANGNREGILVDVLKDPDHTVHTEFTVK